MRRPRRHLKRGWSSVAVLALVLGAVVAGIVAPSEAHAAGFALSCSTLYGIDWRPQSGTDHHAIYSFRPADGALTTVATVDISGGAAARGNGLAMSRTAMWAATQMPGQTSTTIYKVDPASGAVTNFVVDPLASTLTSGITFGAINPANGDYYFGGLAGTRLVVYALNTVTGTFVGKVGSLTVPDGVNDVADIAFDGSGRMYFTTNSTAGTAPTTLYMTGNPVPGTAGDPTLPVSMVMVTPVNTPATGSLAFGGDGYLYQVSLGRGELAKINPVTGRIDSTTSLSGPGSTNVGDIASCAVPSTMLLQENLPDGRVKPSDQFHLSLTGGGLAVGNTSLTAGATSGVQNHQPSETAGPVLGFGGASYTIRVTAADSTDLRTYVSSWSCVDTLNKGRVVATGSGTSGSLTMPSVATGANVVCTFSTRVARPHLTIATTPSRSMVVAGQTITYVLVARNSGDLTLHDITVVDRFGAPAGLGVRFSCPPGDLAPGATVTCTSSPYTVTPADVEAGSVANTATASALTASGSLVTSPAANTTTSTVRSPGLRLVKKVHLVRHRHGDREAGVGVGDEITWRFTLLNTGNVALRGLAVDDTLLADVGVAVTCPRTRLFPAESMVCVSAPYTITEADMAAGHVADIVIGPGSSSLDTHVAAPLNGTLTEIGPAAIERFHVGQRPARSALPGRALAFTGADVAHMAAVAVVALLTGVALMVGSRWLRSRVTKEADRAHV